MAKDPAYIRDALLVDDGGVNVPQHSSGSYFGGGSTRNKTIGRGMRSISSKVLSWSSICLRLCTCCLLVGVIIELQECAGPSGQHVLNDGKECPFKTVCLLFVCL